MKREKNYIKMSWKELKNTIFNGHEPNYICYKEPGSDEIKECAIGSDLEESIPNDWVVTVGWDEKYQNIDNYDSEK